MTTKKLMLTGVALLTALATYAQTPAPTTSHHPHLTPEQRTARREEHKAKLAAMSPADRKAFKQQHRDRMKARVAAMTPEQRERFMEKKRVRKEKHRAERGK